MHATPTAREFFLANFYPSGPFTRIFSNTFPDVFLCWLWLTPVPVGGPQNKIDRPAHRFMQLMKVPMLRVPAQWKKASKHVLLFFWHYVPK